jgi:hypothetical protein
MEIASAADASPGPDLAGLVREVNFAESLPGFCDRSADQLGQVEFREIGIVMPESMVAARTESSKNGIPDYPVCG